MSLAVFPWLPAASRGDLEAMMHRLVETWLEDWVVGFEPVDVATPARVVDESGGWSGGSGRWVHATENDLVALGLRACGGRADRINSVDRAVLKLVAEEMCDDLLERLGAWSPAVAEARPASSLLGRDGVDGAKHRFRVTGPIDGWSFLIALDDAALVRLRKRLAGASRIIDPAPLIEALAGETVMLGCHLGKAEISVAELTALAAGDVLVLDRRLDGPVPVTIDGKPARTGQARIGAQDGSVEVTLTEAIDVMQGL